MSANGIRQEEAEQGSQLFHGCGESIEGGREGGGRGGCITLGWGERESSGKDEKARV